jgi:hypothetical protein
MKSPSAASELEAFFFLDHFFDQASAVGAAIPVSRHSGGEPKRL